MNRHRQAALAAQTQPDVPAYAPSVPQEAFGDMSDNAKEASPPGLDLDAQCQPRHDGSASEESPACCNEGQIEPCTELQTSDQLASADLPSGQADTAHYLPAASEPPQKPACGGWSFQLA